MSDGMSEANKAMRETEEFHDNMVKALLILQKRAPMDLPAVRDSLIRNRLARAMEGSLVDLTRLAQSAEGLYGYGNLASIADPDRTDPAASLKEKFLDLLETTSPIGLIEIGQHETTLDNAIMRTLRKIPALTNRGYDPQGLKDGGHVVIIDLDAFEKAILASIRTGQTQEEAFGHLGDIKIVANDLYAKRS